MISTISCVGVAFSKSSAIIGSLINIKPLLWLDASGKLVPLAKIRGRKKAIKEMVLQATQDIGHSTAIVAYANDIEAAENLKSLVTEVCVLKVSLSNTKSKLPDMPSSSIFR